MIKLELLLHLGILAYVLGVLIFLQRNRLTHARRLAAPVLNRVRTTLGWCCIILGVLEFWFPLPLGIPLIVLGTALVGRRSRLLRLAYIQLRRILRRWARVRIPIVGHAGRYMLRSQRKITAEYRRFLWRRAEQRRIRRPNIISET